MIDTHAVVAGVDALVDAGRNGQGGELQWLEEQLGPLPVQQGAAADGSYTVTLSGKSAKTVALGGRVGTEAPAALVISVETVKALAKRYGSELPCTLQVQLFEGQTGATDAAAQGPGLAAYLELAVANSEGGPAALGMVSAGTTQDEVPFHARLIALGDEAIRELTGKAASAGRAPASRAEQLARQGVPTAVMSVQLAGGKVDEGGRLALLQAAESFGRWAEATMHLVAGDEVDLWAREHRLPHVEQH